MAESSFKGIAGQFVTSYYQIFDADRSQLGQFYRLDSKLSFEGDERQGAANILEKLMSLPFQVVQHVGTTVDAQLLDGYGLLIFVLGQLKTDDDPPHMFSQTFVLKQFGDSLFITNEIFRLGLHHQ
ncbi:nuclear transport factor 2-like [Corticium candelabrum]|uniref:nuclear transport factor 2-like n=1 Tax=Corticium candelabrum TaxID=121492 RepID=UPI002E26283C|nr:nuclear transport factor 2-like [Corticium candelabrum]